jgi:putative tricarboxylic transport membrane protein
MDTLNGLVHALPGILQWQNLFVLVLGVVGGIVVGALPGVSAPMGIAMLIPLTYGMDPIMALGLLAGVHNGASYGGAIPAVLLRIPGTPSSLFSTFDGYPLAEKGLAGTAIRVSAVSSAVGGVISSLSLILLAPPLMLVTLAFGPPEIFWVTVLGIAAISMLLGDSPLKGVLSACLGILVGVIGIDDMNSQERYTFGFIELAGGNLMLAALTGLYALPPAWQMAEKAVVAKFTAEQLRFRDPPGLWSVRRLTPAWIISSIVGIITGILPGSGGGMSSAIAYNETKRISRHPEEFGSGSVEGLAAAECSNNADNAAAMIPALTLGVPGSGVATLMLGALLIQGFHPGPALFRDAPDVVYGYMLQMLIGAALILPLGGFVLTRLFAQVLRLPQALLGLLIITTTVVGVYTVNNSMFDVYLLLIFGLLGYFMERLDYPTAPFVLGLVLGGVAEYQLRLSLVIGGGEWISLFNRPISMVLIALIVLLIALPIVRFLRANWHSADRRGASFRSLR